MKVAMSAPARADLCRIALWIAESNPARSISFTRELRAAAQDIGHFPQSYPVAGKFDGLDVRRKVYGNYLIFYIVTPEAVTIVRILHGAQDYADLF